MKQELSISRKSHFQRFTYFGVGGVVLLLVVIVITLRYGASVIAYQDIWAALWFPDLENFTHLTVRDIRLPRALADLIVGVALAVAGAIMQGTTKNPMSDSGIMGISAGATLGVVIVTVYLPAAGRFERMGVSALGAAFVTLLIYAIAYFGRGRITPERMVLSGMAISTLLFSLTTAIILQRGIMSQMVRYTSGSSANTIWKDLAIATPFFFCGIVVALILARFLTVMNLGEEVSLGLGANTKLIKALATIVVLLLSAVAVIIIGPVSYVGLLIPYVVRYMAGSDYRLVLPLCAVYGALFVVTVDFLTKIIVPGLEFPIGLLISIVGIPFFIYVSRKQQGDGFCA